MKCISTWQLCLSADRRPRRIFLVKSTNPHHSESRDLERCAAYPVVTNVLSVVNNHWKTMFWHVAAVCFGDAQVQMKLSAYARASESEHERRKWTTSMILLEMQLYHDILSYKFPRAYDSCSWLPPPPPPGFRFVLCFQPMNRLRKCYSLKNVLLICQLNSSSWCWCSYVSEAECIQWK